MKETAVTSPVTRTPLVRSSHLARTLGTELDQLLGEFGLRGRLPFAWFDADAAAGPWMPVVEVHEKGSDFFIRAELPGLSKEDVIINVTDDSILLEGERKQDTVKDEPGYYRSERRYGQFRRVFALPEGADPSSAVATFKDGILEIAVHINAPKAPEVRRLAIG